MTVPPVHYARSGELHIAYQLIGDGPRNVLFISPTPFEIDLVWSHPRGRAVMERFSSFGRTAMFNRRGSGLSDPIATVPTLEEQMADIDAVLGEAGMDRAAVFAQVDGVPVALLYAATHPERVTHLALFHGMARMTRAADFRIGLPDGARRAFNERWLEHWADGWVVGELVAPEAAAEDPSVIEWWARMQRAGASPGTARRLMDFWAEIDVRAILGDVQAPTLILGRSECPWPGMEQQRYLAERIPGARLVELPGRDMMLPGSGFDATLDEIEGFITGAKPRPTSSRALATVLFTDIVGSTERAAELGDAAWRELLERQDELARALVAEHGGRLVKSTGDGHLATFSGPAAGIRCASALAAGTRERGIELRSGMHTGEVELIGDDVAGLAVHIAARVAALAGPSEVVVSRTVKDLVVGSGIAMSDRGEHQLKGVPELWRVYAVDPLPIPTG